MAQAILSSTFLNFVVVPMLFARRDADPPSGDLESGLAR